MPTPLKTTAPEKLLERVVQAATGGKTFKQATREISEAERQSLSRAIGMDVEEWRQQFGQELRKAGSLLIADLIARKDELKAGEIAYSLAVVTDKAQALDGRSQLASASVNVQINHFGGATKSALLDQLDGRIAQVVEAVESFPSTTERCSS